MGKVRDTRELCILYDKWIIDFVIESLRQCEVFSVEMCDDEPLSRRLLGDSVRRTIDMLLCKRLTGRHEEALSGDLCEFFGSGDGFVGSRSGTDVWLTKLT